MSKRDFSGSIVCIIGILVNGCGWACDDCLDCHRFSSKCNAAQTTNDIRDVGLYLNNTNAYVPGDNVYFSPNYVELAVQTLTGAEHVTIVVTSGIFPVAATSIINYRAYSNTMIESIFQWPVTNFTSDLTYSEVKIGVIVTTGSNPVTRTTEFSAGTSEYALQYYSNAGRDPLKIAINGGWKEGRLTPDPVWFEAPYAWERGFADVYQFKQCNWYIDGEYFDNDCRSNSKIIGGHDFHEIKLRVDYQDFSISATKYVQY